MSREDDLKRLSAALFRSPSDALVSQEVVQIVLESAKSASATFIGKMAEPWPDPEVILDDLWSASLESLEDDMDELMDVSKVNWDQLETAWRREVRRIYAAWGSG